MKSSDFVHCFSKFGINCVETGFSSGAGLLFAGFEFTADFG
jgi:hypothetical protein